MASATGVCFALRVANLYLVMMADGRTEEIATDFYDRVTDAQILKVSDFRLGFRSEDPLNTTRNR